LWLYAGDGTDSGAWEPAAQIPVHTGLPEPIRAFPTTGSARLAPETSTAFRADPVTGRLIVPVQRVFEPGGIWWVQVADPDGHDAYRVDVREAIGAEWAGDGGLLVLEANAFPALDWTHLVRFDENGRVHRDVLDTGRVSNASILAVRDGFALLAFVDAGDRSAELVLVRLSDGTASGLRVSFSDVAGLELGAWLPRSR
jgi:hypothetical protein